jgi:hypothetical protein
MANLNAPSGLAPVMHRDGSMWNGQARMYCVLAADTNPYYIGDLVKVAANADANGIPAITLGTAGAQARGVVVAIGTNAQGGPYINPNNLTLTNRPTGAQAVNYYALVVDDPTVVFEIQEVNSGVAGNAVNMNKNANIVYALPTTGVFVSGTTLDNTTYATTSTLNLKVMGTVQRNFGGGLNGNVPFTLAQRLLCVINSHDFSAGTNGT